MTIPRPPNEAMRLEALRRYDLLDSGADAEFDFLTELAAHICQTPYAFVSLVDEYRVWYKSAHGCHASQQPRDEDYCAWSILEPQGMNVSDLRVDARTAQLALTLQGPRYCMYNGANLVSPDGYHIGVLCVLDTTPRKLSEQQVSLLHRLAQQVVALMELRRVSRELKDALDVATRLANEDTLTGLPNRRAWFETARQQLALCRRMGKPFSVCMLDVDHFKRINDVHGHPAGDAVLQALGKLLAETCRSTDTPGRLGGEEFALLMPGTDAEGACQKAEALRLAIANLIISTERVQIQITASLGVSSSPPDRPHETLDAVLGQADQALYAAKHGGRNRVVNSGPV